MLKMSQQNYTRVLNELTRCVQGDTLMEIKEYFREDVDSNRVFEMINSFSCLIKILEIRDSLSQDNARALLLIAEKLNRFDLIAYIGQGGNNQNVVEQAAAPAAPLPRAAANMYAVLPEVPKDFTSEVFDLISSEIGHKWKILARQLNIAEGYIDNLETQHKTVKERVLEILKYHKGRVDPNYWIITLFRALGNSRRRDLTEKVQDVCAKHGLRVG